MMEEKKGLLPPPAGYAKELAKLCGCGPVTVWKALHRGARGPKADMVRKMYRAKYVEGR
jgi:hypothetical protein